MNPTPNVTPGYHERAVSTVHKHVAELQRKGYVFREPDSRTVALAGHHDTCPLCGRSLETTAS